MNDIFSVRDKVIIVTGAARGNGKAIADGFVKYGAIVYYVDKLLTVKKNINIDKTKRSKGFVVDLSIKSELQNFVDSIANSQSIDVLINNAGITLPTDTDNSLNKWEAVLRVNLTSVYDLSRKIIELMKVKDGGSIINITSLSSHLGFSKNYSYTASKSGLQGLTRTLAYDYGKYNIRVNNICPGYILTNMTKGSFRNKEKRENIKNRSMLNRWGKSEDLVGASIFLASKASSFITGIDLIVDGGWCAKGI